MAADKISEAVERSVAATRALATRHGADLERFAALLVEKFHLGHRLLLFGNGPYSTVSALIANLFLHRLNLNRPALPALALGHDALLAASLARDGLSRQYFSRQLRAVATRGDVVLSLAEGERDESLSEAWSVARELGCVTAILAAGSGAPFGESPDFLFQLEADAPQRGVETALFFGHLLCELVEGEIFGT